MILWLGCTAQPPDVLIVSVDTLRADASVPTMAGGRVFTQATTPLPRTTPALGSLLTGLAPHQHGSREVGEPVAHGQTLAELLPTSSWPGRRKAGSPGDRPGPGTQRRATRRTKGR